MSARSHATEFARRRNLPGVTVRIMPAGRTFTVELSQCGRHIGTRVDVTTRGKVTSSTYHLPPLEVS
jgi:hypothetical protein